MVANGGVVLRAVAGITLLPVGCGVSDGASGGGGELPAREAVSEAGVPI